MLLHLDRVFAVLIPLGELLVGIGLILGVFTLAAAGFGALMNLAYLLAGSTSAGLNPLMLTFGLMLLAAGPAAYEYGVDRVARSRVTGGRTERRAPRAHRWARPIAH